MTWPGIISLCLCVLVQLCVGEQGQFISDHIIHRPPPQRAYRPRPGQPMKVAESTNAFALDLHHALPYEGNSFFSPLAISTVLSMVYLGAKDETKQQMASVLGFESSGLKGDEPHYGFQQIQKYLSRKNASNEFKYVKSVFIRNKFKILEEYQEKLRSFYNASVKNVDFANDSKSVTEHLNRWVAEATRNKIPQFLDKPLDSATVLFLMSAVYFKGFWNTQFRKNFTERSKFYNEGKNPAFVSMMRMKTNLPFMLDKKAGFMAIEMPYEGNETSMLVLLPESRTGLPDLERALDLVMLEDIVSQLTLSSVQVEMPRFHIEADYDLPDVLKSIGMTSLFDESKADLSGITGSKNIYVNDVFHKAVIDVNEEGSEAAAVAGAGAVIRVGLANSAYFVVDHPFLFLIRDIRSGLIYFMGRVNHL